MFDPSKDPLENHRVERHAGKAMLISNDDSLSITIDCIICGRIEITSIPLTHLSSIIQMLQRVADSLDIGLATSAQLVGEEAGDDIELGKQLYEQMPVDPRSDETLSKLLDATADDDPWSH